MKVLRLSAAQSLRKPVPESALLALGALVLAALISAAVILFENENLDVYALVPLALEIPVVVFLSRSLPARPRAPGRIRLLRWFGMLGFAALASAVFFFWPSWLSVVALGLEFPLVGWLDHSANARAAGGEDPGTSERFLRWYWGVPLGFLFGTALVTAEFFHPPGNPASAGLGITGWIFGILTVVYVVSRATRKLLPLLGYTAAGYAVFLASALAAWYVLMLLLHPC